MCDVTHGLTPPPVTNCHTFLHPPPERDVLYGRPHTIMEKYQQLELSNCVFKLVYSL
jgi:hypothetical protein